MFLNLFRSRPPMQSPAAAAAPRAPQVPQFPPVDTGIEVVPVVRLMEANTDLLQRIRLSYGCDDATFKRFIVDVVERYARFVHLLPATPDNFFRERGGLLRMGLEIGFFALQGTDGQIFGGRQTISQRRLLEPRWRYAAFLAGLLSEVHRALNQLIVIGEDGQSWPAYLGGVVDWCESCGRDRYFLRWTQRARENRATALFVLPQVVPSDLMHWLNQDNTVIVPQLMGSIGGLPAYHEASVIDQLVRRCVAVVIDTDLRSSADRYGRPAQGAHLERYLVDAMRRLVASRVWQINAEKSRVWFGRDGLFLVWPGGATEIVRLLAEKDELPGIPKSPETLAELLVAAGAFEAAQDGSAVWQIAPPGASVALNAVKLSSPTILLSALPSGPPPLDIELCRPVPPNASLSVAVGGAGSAHPAAASAGPSVMPLHASATVAAVAPGRANGRHATQLEIALNPEGGASRAANSPSERGESARAVTSPRYSLKAPPKMSPAVRAALSEIIETLNGPGSSAACRSVRQGLFVPLRAFEARSIEPSLAVRSLSSADMIVPAKDGAKTRSLEFDREATLGVVLRVAFVNGFDGRDFEEREPC